MILHGLATTILDLAVGLGIVLGALILIAGVLWLEARLERRETEPEPAPEYVDAWASFPPRWNPSEGEAKAERRRPT